MQNKIKHQPTQASSQRGGVSIFITIFATLLITVIILSFASMMNQERNRAVDGELSQSAYDSALAGVEDAKRAVAKCDKNPGADGCDKLYQGDCSAIQRVGIAGSVGAKETKIQREVGSVDAGEDVNLAYTCVKISDKVPNYEGETSKAGGAISVPLRGASDVRKLRIEWHADKDSAAKFDNSKCSESDHAKLCTKAQWAEMPALIRAQIVIPGETFTLGSLDSNAAKSVYLRPVKGSDSGMSIIGHRISSFSRVAAGDVSAQTNAPMKAFCRVDSSANYKCAAELELPGDKTIPRDSKTSMMRLTTMYRKSSLRVTMLDASNNPVNFLGVQTIVDSTGRANNVFRRVEARLEPRSFKDMDIPNYALDLGGSLCKDFSVIHEANAKFPRSDGCRP